MSGDLQQEKKDHEKEEQAQEHELEGPALPARVLSIDEPPPPADVELPGPGADFGGNNLLATVEPAGIDAPSWGGGEGAGGGGGGSGGAGEAEGGSVTAPASK